MSNGEICCAYSYSPVATRCEDGFTPVATWREGGCPPIDTRCVDSYPPVATCCVNGYAPVATSCADGLPPVATCDCKSLSLKQCCTWDLAVLPCVTVHAFKLSQRKVFMGVFVPWWGWCKGSKKFEYHRLDQWRLKACPPVTQKCKFRTKLKHSECKIILPRYFAGKGLLVPGR